jgi:alkanesulfonate monooxygenase SsuD/methylene tetrahydromethanopterin reductase-like flavin-dependent oxidoreductase (luciferase family)
LTLELGVYTFGNTPHGKTARAIRNVLDAVHVAEEVGLDFFGFGEHHTPSMPLSSPTALVNAAAASTQRIGLGTTVSVLSTDDPIRVYQQLATAAAVAPGRVEVVAGRGASAITFPLFDLQESDYDTLYRSKLDLLLAVNSNERITWNGPRRDRPLEDALVVPRPEHPLPIWLGTGGSPDSVMRAVELGLPMFPGILGGSVEHWATTAAPTARLGAAPATPPTQRASPSPCTGSSPTTTAAAPALVLTHHGRFAARAHDPPD